MEKVLQSHGVRCNCNMYNGLHLLILTFVHLISGPYFLGAYDLGAIRDSGALFVRKVSRTVDENLVRMLPVKRNGDEERTEWEMLPELRWPKLGVKFHDPFVWKAQQSRKKVKDESKGEEEE
jgi:hypothetical protein